MKKIFVLMVLSVMLFSLAISASAATVVYIDGLPNGEVEKENPVIGGTEDLTVNIISAGTMINKVKIGAEYGIGEIENTDLSLWSLKTGYRLVDAKATKLDGIVAVLNIDTDDGTYKGNLDTILAGFDFTQYFSERAFLTASLVYSINGSYENSNVFIGKDDDASVNMYRLKFHYLLNENLGLTAGYTKLSYNFVADALGSVDVAMGGFNVGLVYIFR